jgi:hypothetical protein
MAPLFGVIAVFAHGIKSPMPELYSNITRNEAAMSADVQETERVDGTHFMDTATRRLCGRQQEVETRSRT